MSNGISPAELLAGQLLLEKWFVTEKLVFDEGETGRTKSCCYSAVGPNNQSAFVKAFSFIDLVDSGDTEELQRQLAEFHNERKVHELCSDLRRITRIFDNGHISIAGKTVHFIVCEAGEASLRRSQPPGDTAVPASTRLLALRQITTALIQLHGRGVAHQDLKPSNAVQFSSGTVTKITDMGSASCQGLPPPPHDEQPYAGQVNYAPYELLYSRVIQPNWYRRRVGCDVFLLGNLIFTSFTGVSLSALILHAIPVPLRFTHYAGEYEQVLPDLVVKHVELVPVALEGCIAEYLYDDVVDLVLKLCHPDPTKRGMHKGLGPSDGPFDLQRCEGRLNTLSRRAEIYERRTSLVRQSA